MPQFPIVDAHVHLYDPRSVRYSWMDGSPDFDRRHGFEDFAAAAAEVAVEGIVFVEVAADEGQALAEAHWVEHQGHGQSLLRGIVGALPIELGDAIAADLDAFAVLPHACGLRRLIQDRPAGFTLQAGFIEGLHRLAKLDLPFDVCLRHGQMAEVIDLVKRCPDNRFVLDHLGKPPIRAGADAAWRQHLRELSRLPHVFAKISGLATEADPAEWRFEDIEPYIAHAIECFGFHRLMFGGDWPVARSATTYARWVETVDVATRGATAAELDCLFRKTAMDFYRL